VYGATLVALPGLALAVMERGALAHLGWLQVAASTVLGLALAAQALVADARGDVAGRAWSGDLGGLERDIRLSDAAGR